MSTQNVIVVPVEGAAGQQSYEDRTESKLDIVKAHTRCLLTLRF